MFHSHLQVTKIGKSDQTVELLTFINHTECHCVSKQHEYRHQASTTNIQTLMSEENCVCPKHFTLSYDTDNEDDENGNGGHRRCLCDCSTSSHSHCDRLRRGTVTFSTDDRRYIVFSISII